MSTSCFQDSLLVDSAFLSISRAVGDDGSPYFEGESLDADGVLWFDGEGSVARWLRLGRSSRWAARSHGWSPFGGNRLSLSSSTGDRESWRCSAAIVMK